jgi:GT2 family glycosyltransferase
VTPSPSVSVVVSTHQRRDLLARLLDALAAQELDRPFEVVVVVDGSTDGTSEMLQARAQEASRAAGTAGTAGALRGWLQVLVQNPALGPAGARNRGWRAASGEVVVFTDDDCYPAPGWLAALVGALAESGSGLAQGVTRPERSAWDGSGPFARTMWVLEEDGFYATCNMAYRRDVLEKVGGFDERFRRPFGEDTDLAWRALESGATATFVADAVMYHQVWPSSWKAHLRDRHRREGIVLAARLHPQIRDRFYRRHWYQGSHHRALLAAAGLAAALAGLPSRSRAPRLLSFVLGVAWTAPYLDYRLRERRLPCRTRNLAPVIALALVADLYEVGVLAAASAKYRTLLL